MNGVFADSLDEATERWPDRDALVIDAQRMTFRTLAEESRQLAFGWLEWGVEPGDRVGLLLENGVAWALNFWALARIGAVATPLNPRWTASELRGVLDQAQLKALLIGDRYRRMDFQKLFAEATERNNGANCVPLVVTTASSPPDGFVPLAALRSVTPSAARRSRAAQIQAAQRGDSVAVIQFTSGSTAFPKGVMLRQGAMIDYVRDYGQRLGVTPEDRVLCQMPFFHIAGLNHVLLVPVVQGATVFSAESFDPVLALRQLEIERCTVFGGVSTMYLRIVDKADSAVRAFASIEKAWLQGSSAVCRSVQDLTEVRGLTGHYGATELSGATTFGDVHDPIEVRLTNVGRELPGIETRIVDAANGAGLPVGTVGEIWHRGSRMMAGYFGLPKEHWSIDADGWFHTGDLGFFDQEGYMHFEGRMKEMLKVGGENVACLEVEDVLLSHADVRLAAVIGVPDAQLEESPVAFVELRTGARGAPEALIEHCARSLARFKVPRRVIVMEALPMTGSNKIHKPALRALAMESLELGGATRSDSGERRIFHD